jgi:transcriptional regulator with XRE-family HTH domain
MNPLEAGTLLRRARVSARLSQRALAERAGTSQSVVARIESGVTDPGTATLLGLLDAAGFDLRVMLIGIPGRRWRPRARPAASGAGGDTEARLERDLPEASFDERRSGNPPGAG